jgi:hypothetical protein
LLVLLALSALVGWLLHCVKDGAGGCGGVFQNRLKAGLQYEEVGLVAAGQGCLLAMAPVSEGLLVGAGALVLVGGLFCVGLMLKRWDDARLRWGVVEEDPDFGTAAGFERRWGLTIPEPPKGGTTILGESPEGGTALPRVSAADAVRILHACAYLAGELRLNATLALAGDEQKLTVVVTSGERLQRTLLELKEAMEHADVVTAETETEAWAEVRGGSGS